MTRNPFAGKRVTVIGAGESGLWAAKLLARAGARVRLTSRDPIPAPARRLLLRLRVPFEEGAHTPAFLADTEIVVPSPGVRPSSPPLVLARRKGWRVASELEAAAAFVRGRWIGVTGTNGKTTTSSLIAAMLKNAGPCDLCGNVGRALSRSVLEKGPRIPRVVEVSSFQLHASRAVRPTVAVILNLRPNHLDWHRTLAEYYGAKLKLIRNLGPRGTAVLNADDPTLMRLASRVRVRKLLFSRGPLEEGLFLRGGAIVRRSRGREETVADLGRLKLVGPHNAENVLAATGAALAFGVGRPAIQKALDRFRPLHHRIEPVGRAGGVTFVNDSKSTTVDSTRAALESFGGRIVLLAGGRAKEKNYRTLLPLLKRRVACLVLYGEARKLLARQLRGFPRVVTVERFRDAVERAFREVRPEGTLLLSPMCASFDQFRSYEERGEAFRRIFNELKRASRGGG
jgi:UDP-N-acetylmuramoylalanine--D-glutamate ligase